MISDLLVCIELNDMVCILLVCSALSLGVDDRLILLLQFNQRFNRCNDCAFCRSRVISVWEDGHTCGRSLRRTGNCSGTRQRVSLRIARVPTVPLLRIYIHVLTSDKMSRPFHERITQ